MPEVSIVVPAYNRADVIAETLDSVMNQDFTDWECLIIDDHSTDITAQICADYVARDSRFQFYLNKRSKGAQGARNTGIDKATGKYVIFLDSDDLLGSHCLSNRLAFAEQNPGYNYYCFATAVFKKVPYDTDKLWNYLNTNDNDLIRFLRQDMPWHTSGVLWKREVLQAIKGWDEKVSIWQDWDLHVNALLNKKLTYLKSTNEAVDSFYRKDNSEKAISSTEYAGKSFKTKLYLIEKYAELLPLKSEEVRFEFAKLIYRIADQTFRYFDKDVAIQLLRKWMVKLGYSNLFSKSWVWYMKVKLDKSSHQLLKKGAAIIPILYRKKTLLYNKRHHLTATLSSAK
ncbi:glycosyltransferase family 2 protein [Mucilaginibacter robiniae]|uniref:Glycosyltransferase family 2 protein n=1 Tax=Mucilaginibacter robiniae TaxID=2728022 RepID=A0A7L5E426_9SPHI|nr:glycosyltransferase family A protein [Mucilaginibacter robiniae]QJD97368.1 glycosyltransferase family 2 protein [Mucilaginibacter robiniae]